MSRHDDKFTKVKWKAWQDSANTLTISPEDDNSICIAILQDIDTDEITDEMRDNATLIAAAPELYKALNAFTDFMKERDDCASQSGGWKSNELTKHLMDSMLALKKARGE